MKRHDLMLHMQTHLQETLYEIQFKKPETKIRRVDLKTIKDSLKTKSPGIVIKDTTKISKIIEKPQLETIKKTTLPQLETTKNTPLPTLTDKSLEKKKEEEKPANSDDYLRCKICNRMYSNVKELRLHEK